MWSPIPSTQILDTIARSLGVFAGLLLAAYFLVASASGNALPAYFMAVLVLVAFSSWVRILIHSRIVVGILVVTTYLVLSALWSRPAFDAEMHSVVRNYLLVNCFVVAIVICQIRFERFRELSLGVLTLSATLSASAYLVKVVAVGLDDVDRAIIGRWQTPSVGAIGYGFAGIVALGLTTLEKVAFRRRLWMLCTLVLLTACVALRINYVLFAFLAAATCLAYIQVWRSGLTWYVLPWIVVSFLLMSATIFELNMVIDAGRQLIWSSILDVIYDDGLVFGFGVLSDPTAHIACNASGVELPVECSFSHPHNLYVSTMFYGGMVGIALLIFLLLGTITSAIKSRRMEKSSVVALLAYGFCVLMFDGNRLFSTPDFIWLVLWLPMGLAAFLEIDAKQPWRPVSEVEPAAAGI